ncbi:TBC1 domain family member 25-like isoform X2 [Mizuhopecten yessoensis]|uniref:TBC1 domain family member 25-like isoform X2 n=1 Tax=Mizuhopecten yessoensis TaxID=6573 RepID=UPI000B45C54F|nr:TBC1 domain family member 25-like isoform X2 [Mizuhopecten yessoensis]
MSSPWAVLSFTESDFTLSYRTKDDEGQEIYLSMLSDWDMDAAFQSASDPCLQLKVDLKPFEEGLDDWDIIAPVDVPQYKVSNLVERNSILGSLTGTISNQVGRTVSHMQRVMGLRNEDEQRYRPSKSPMTDMEFRNYLDSSGHMIKPEEFRISIYQGGVEPSLRRVVWRHLLNIFPIGLSGKERFDYMKHKENEYYKLRDKWRNLISSGSISEDLRYITSMVKKDVLRTDRTLKYFAGGDDSKNLLSLFNILVTYAITHPEVSYCQGMSDVASPLLVIQKDEAQAYLCFCGIMARMKSNFMLNENPMSLKFKHLSDILQLHDPVLYAYLKEHDAGDLFFCYRWLLLELKREFPFEDALYMLEVMWSTLPPMYPESELPLTDQDYFLSLLSTSPCSPSFSKKPSIYEKFRNMRRVKSSKVQTGEETEDNSVNNNTVLVSKNVTNTGKASPFEEEKSIVGAQDFPSMKDSMVVDAQAKSSCIDKSLETEMESKVKKLHDHVKNIQTEAQISEDTEAEVLKEQTTDVASCDSVFSVSDLSSSVHDERPAGSFYNGDLTSETPTDGTDSEEVETLFSKDQAVPDGSINNDPNFCRGSLTTEFKSDATDDELCNDYIDEDQDDSGHSQFYLSLDSTDEGQTEGQTSVAPDNKTVKKTGERPGFFHNVKELISIPKKRPTEISVPKVVAGFKAPDIVQDPLTVQNSNADLKVKDMGNSSQKSFLSNGLVHGKKMYPGKAVLSPVSGAPVTIGGKGVCSSSLPLNDSGMSLSDCAEVSDDNSLEVIKHSIASIRLPPPDVFGNGNPFLMFVCVTLLMQHREAILQKQLEYDEIAMMFDRMVRKHNVHKVLHQARILYTDYLQTQKKIEEQAEADDHVFSV